VSTDDDLPRMFNSEFARFCRDDYDFPRPSHDQIEALNKTTVERVNNGVYPPGSQLARRFTSVPRPDYSRPWTNWTRGSRPAATCSATA
jgi:hypothetical protein